VLARLRPRFQDRRGVARISGRHRDRHHRARLQIRRMFGTPGEFARLSPS